MKTKCDNLEDLIRDAFSIHRTISVALCKSACGQSDDAADRLDKAAEECEALAAQCRDAASKLRTE